MKHVLEQLYNYTVLSREEAYTLLKNVATGVYNESQVAGLLSAYLMRRPVVAELAGFKDAMLELCVQVDITGGYDTIDIVGTGGDGKNTFNISTLSALVVAGAGYKVAKHGNYAASSTSGSSNVMEYLGYRFSADSDILKRQLEENNICFLHAPLFHPAMKNVAPVRKNLGVRTFFNLLGPVINPSKTSHQLLGVSHLSYVKLYQYLLQNSTQQFTIVHSLDGYDEISLTGAFKVVSNNSEQLIDPREIGFEQIQAYAIEAGETVGDAAAVFVSILEGRGTPAQQQVVIANSGFAIRCMNPNTSLEECFALAEDSLASGKAYTIFKHITHR